MIKCLMVTADHDDYIQSCLWDGLQEVLGEANVSETGFNPGLHSYTKAGSACWRVSGNRQGRCLQADDGPVYDLVVVNACHLNTHRDWHFVQNLLYRHAAPGAKVAMVEGGDGYNEVSWPPFKVDAYFRRETRPGYAYPAAVHHLTFSAPSRWLEGVRVEDGARTYDVLNVCSHFSHPTRFHTMQTMWQTTRHHISVACSGALSADRWLDYLRSSRLCVCPPGGADSDCMRFAEAAACGAIPIFVGLPEKAREDWFTHETAFFCGAPGELPLLLDSVLGTDLTGKRRKLLDHVSRHMTTAAMSRKVLGKVGLL